MQTILVFVMTYDHSNEREVCMCNLITSDVSASISPTCIDGFQELLEQSDACLLLLLTGLAIEKSHAFWFLKYVHDSSIEPLRFEILLRGLWIITVLESKHFK